MRRFLFVINLLFLAQPAFAQEACTTSETCRGAARVALLATGVTPDLEAALQALQRGCLEFDDGQACRIQYHWAKRGVLGADVVAELDLVRRACDLEDVTGCVMLGNALYFSREGDEFLTRADFDRMWAVCKTGADFVCMAIKQNMNFDARGWLMELCAEGHGAACAMEIARFKSRGEDEGRGWFALCYDEEVSLACIYLAENGVPNDAGGYSSTTAFEHYAQGCKLGSSHACRNGYGYAVSTNAPRIKESVAMVRRACRLSQQPDLCVATSRAELAAHQNPSTEVWVAALVEDCFWGGARSCDSVAQRFEKAPGLELTLDESLHGIQPNALRAFAQLLSGR